MRKPTAFFLAAVLALFTLTACGQRSPQDFVSAALGIDASAGIVISAWDTHGGFHGDGITYIALEFSDESVLQEIQRSPAWKPFPLDETVQILVYGISGESDGMRFQRGPYLDRNDHKSIVPDIRNGYYLLIDRQKDKESDILSRSSLNFTVGLYDTDTHTLYCCALDT